MRRSVAAVGAFVVLSLAVGCQTANPARVVARQGDGGVVAIPNNSNDKPSYYRDKAVGLIVAHVGPDFVIDKEEEVVTGQRTVNNQNIDHGKPLDPKNPFLPAQQDRVSTVSSTSDTTEYRITYRRTPKAPLTQPIGPAGGTGVGMVPSVQPGGGVTPASGTMPAGPSGVVPAGGMMPAAGTTTGRGVRPAVGMTCENGVCR